MPRYLTFFSYDQESWRHMVQHPEDRAEAARQVVETAGGRLESFYWTLGEHDGLAIFEADDAESATAILAGIAASGRVLRLQTTALLTSAEAHRALVRAKDVAAAYRPPGGATAWLPSYDQLG
jgi:uncharacterized protein with GYD domain